MRRLNIDKSLLRVAIFLLFVALPMQTVRAVPISSCLGVDADHYSCNIFESDAGGNPTEISNIISAPPGSNPVSAGYLVLMDSGDPTNATDQANIALWSDVLQFIGNTNLGTGSTEFQLFSIGCNTANPFDSSCFNAAYADIFGANQAAAFFDLEPVNPPYVYFPDQGNATSSHVYNVWFGPEIPEPATLGSLACGLLGLAGWKKRRVNRQTHKRSRG